jgi:ureidoacrylate peracid hydrolase
MASAERPEIGGPDVHAPDPFSAKQAQRPAPAVAPAQTALLVVDMVNDYLEPDGAMPAADGEPVVAANRRLAAAARAAGVEVVWIRPGHRDAEDGLFRKRIVHALEGSWGAALHDGLDVRDGERIVSKRRYSAFFATDLDLHLRERDVRRVVVSGVALNICVRSTVHDAFFLGYDVWVARDACRATGPREEASTLYDIQTHFGEVRTVAEIEQAWR